MEEKRHPKFEEEESVGMVSEPVGTAVATETCLVDDAGEDLDWDKFPSLGPFSEEEAIARIEQAEKDLKDPSKWVSSEDFDRQLYEEFPQNRYCKVLRSFIGNVIL